VLGRFISKVTFAGLLLAAPALAQTPEAPSQAAQPAPKRYANMPDEAVPYRNFSKPYKEWFVDADTLEYNGAARDRVDEEMLKSATVNFGFLGPIENNPESPYGIAMLHGAQLALEEANARGGYRGTTAAPGKPYALKVHNDVALWGASSFEAVKMAFDEHVISVLGSIDGASTHIMLRVSLKLEFPIMDTGTTDPTVTETRIPWVMHDFPDDRQQGYTLADYIFKQLKLKRIGVIRTQSRYARVGVAKFFDEAKRMGHVPVFETKFDRGDTDFSQQIRMLQGAKLDAVVIWGEAKEAGLILKQMRAAGMKQPVFGSSRTGYAETVAVAGNAAEGFVCTSPLDLSRSDARWVDFVQRYRTKFNEEPDAYAAYAYDGMNILIGAVEKAGLNRGKVMDAFREYVNKTYDGVAETEHFDATLNNIAPLGLARVEGGRFVYWNPRAPAVKEAAKSGGQY
jgi:branched-chain amino acid transport system substrate-binding protein